MGFLACLAERCRVHQVSQRAWHGLTQNDPSLGWKSSQPLPTRSNQSRDPCRLMTYGRAMSCLYKVVSPCFTLVPQGLGKSVFKAWSAWNRPSMRTVKDNVHFLTAVHDQVCHVSFSFLSCDSFLWSFLSVTWLSGCAMPGVGKDLALTSPFQSLFTWQFWLEVSECSFHSYSHIFPLDRGVS